MMEITIEQAINMLKAEEAKLADLNKRIADADALLRELVTAKATLENLPDKETETLVPVGGGIFLPVSASKKTKVLVSVGAGVSTEKTIDETVKFLDKRIDAVKKTLNDLINLANKTQKNISVLRAKIDEAIKKSQQPPAVVG